MWGALAKEAYIVSNKTNSCSTCKNCPAEKIWEYAKKSVEAARAKGYPPEFIRAECHWMAGALKAAISCEDWLKNPDKGEQRRRLHHGREHPFQQIKDGQTAARLALDEVMKINDTAPADVWCDFSLDWCFGSWYSSFLDDRRRAMKEGRKYTFKEGELKIIEHFCPTPEMIRQREEAVAAWRDCVETAIVANRGKPPRSTPGIINLRSLEGFHYFTAGWPMKPNPNGSGMIFDSDSPIKWVGGSIRFEDGSAIDRDRGGEFHKWRQTFNAIGPTKPLMAISMAVYITLVQSTHSVDDCARITLTIVQASRSRLGTPYERCA